jgi:hypothetical protein
VQSPLSRPPERNTLKTNVGYLGALLDLTFSEFVTTRLLKWFYIIAVGAAGLAALGWLLTSLDDGFSSIVVALVVAPLGFVLAATMARVMVELIIVMFRIAENTGRTADEAAIIAGNTEPAIRSGAAA